MTNSYAARIDRRGHITDVHMFATAAERDSYLDVNDGYQSIIASDARNAASGWRMVTVHGDAQIPTTWKHTPTYIWVRRWMDTNWDDAMVYDLITR